MMSIFIVHVVGWAEKCPGREDYCTNEMSVVLKVVRNEMGALFCTMP
jgi:hypothetical protein